MSVSANIEEGFRKKTKPDKARYLNIAHRSLEKCRYYLVLVTVCLKSGATLRMLMYLLCLFIIERFK